MKRIGPIVATLVALAAPAWAQLQAQTYVSGLSSPLAFVQDPSDPTVQYVVEQGGRIKVVKNGVLRSAVFLDLSGSIVSGGEQGLLGLAFAPDYATSRRFFVNFTNPQGHTVVARFLRSTSDPLVAVPSSRFDLMWPGGLRYIFQPFANHNGGTLAFGPDGYLYIGMGDGGSGNDPQHRAQNPAELLGKMLRIDVAVSDVDSKGYKIPPDNPFLSGPMAVALDEIWAFGLRNPWKFTFDDPLRGGTGALVIGDVGQSAWEEIDYEPPHTGGRNYGWRNREGAHNNVTSLPAAYMPLTDPIFEYDHTAGQSVTGGYVYRGAALGTTFRGRYFFADISGRAWSIALVINPTTGEATATGLVEHTSELGGSTALGLISSFGVDAAGELYIVSLTRNTIYRIASTAAATGDEIAMDFGASGLWTRYNNGLFARLHTVSPRAMATGDLDGNGKADLIVDFPGAGVWVWSNDAGWFQLHTVNAASIATGDLDGNGLDEVLLDFPGFGLWVRVNNSGWFQLHAASPSRMVTADLDGNGKAEAIIDFPGAGVWVWKNNTSWSQLHPANAAAMVAGDFDGGGRTDLLIDFPGFGLWVWSNNTSWFRLHAADATVMTTGDLDGNGKADAIISFPGFGIWAWMNSAGFVQLHASNAALMTAADIDGNGRDDVIISFPGFGVWSWMNHASWQQLHTQNPEGMAAGNLDGR
jgi:glucose/arabinose dehydrogenase